MKKILLYSLSATLLMANSPQSENIDDKQSLIREYQEMFQKISQKRVGLQDSQIAKVKPPFLKIVKKKKGTKSASRDANKKVQLVLEAILGNRVMINGNWYSLHQSVGSYKIVSIKDDTVCLKGDTTKLKLKIRKKNANIIIK